MGESPEAQLKAATIAPLIFMPRTNAPSPRVRALIEDIAMYGAMLQVEARDLYGDSTLKRAKERWVEVKETCQGNVLYLSHRGRQVRGYASAYSPPEEALVNNLAERQVVKVLEAEGLRLKQGQRKHTFDVLDDGQSFTFAARYTGFNFRAVRRLYQQTVLEGNTPQLRVYVPAELIHELTEDVAMKNRGSALIIEPNSLLIEAIPQYVSRKRKLDRC